MIKNKITQATLPLILNVLLITLVLMAFRYFGLLKIIMGIYIFLILWLMGEDVYFR